MYRASRPVRHGLFGKNMAKKIVYMVRHGLIQSNIEEVYSGRSSERLTQRGAEEAHALGQEMAGWGIRVIYASPLARTVQTAEILNEYIGGELIMEPNVIEMDLGPWTGLSKVEVARRYPSEYGTWFKKPAEFKAQGMETLHDVQQRTIRALDDLLRMSSEDVAAVVTHAVVVKCALLYFQGLSLNAYHDFQVLNLSVHQATFNAGKGFVRMVRKGAGSSKAGE